MYEIVYNNKKKVSKFVKKDLAESQLLTGAEFKIYNEDNTIAYVFKNGELIKEAAADIINNKKVQLALPSGLMFGNYQLIETKAPKRYLPNEEPYALNWNCNMDFKKDHIITNRKIELGTFIQKTGGKIIKTNGPFSYEFNTIRNTSNVPLGSFT